MDWGVGQCIKHLPHKLEGDQPTLKRHFLHICFRSSALFVMTCKLTVINRTCSFTTNANFILFSSNGEWKESIHQWNVSLAPLKFTGWRSTFTVAFHFLRFFSYTRLIYLMHACHYEDVYVTIVHQAFYTFSRQVMHGGDVSQQKVKSTNQNLRKSWCQ